MHIACLVFHKDGDSKIPRCEAVEVAIIFGFTFCVGTNINICSDSDVFAHPASKMLTDLVGRVTVGVEINCLVKVCTRRLYLL